MKFSKAKWLETANAQKAEGILTQADIDNALKTWVNALDGKTIDPNDESNQINPAWLV